jgi:hypothetical protein
MRGILKHRIYRSALTGAVVAALWFGAVIQTRAAQPPTPAAEEAPSEEMIKAILVQEAVKIMLNNLKASQRESGEMAKLLRAISGVSVKDIEQYGICGGPNSEVRKLFGSLC